MLYVNNSGLLKLCELYLPYIDKVRYGNLNKGSTNGLGSHCATSILVGKNKIKSNELRMSFGRACM